MKKGILILAAIVFFSTLARDKDTKCNKWENRQLYRGEKGGCYYIKIKDNKRTKVYVDKEKCKC